MNLATLYMPFCSRGLWTGLALGLTLSAPAAWAQSALDCRRPPAPPQPPCGDYDDDAHCNPCWIEPWMCPPPKPPVPPCAEDDACGPCMADPSSCRPPLPKPPE